MDCHSKNNQWHCAKHQGALCELVAVLFQQTPATNKKHLSVEKKVSLYISDGAPIMANNHPAIMKMFKQPMVGLYYVFCLLHYTMFFIVNDLVFFNDCAMLAGNSRKSFV